MKKAIIHVDPQVDFTTGALATHPDPSIFDNMNRLSELQDIDVRVVTGDKHGPDCVEYETYGVHCQEGSAGVSFDERFYTDKMDLVLYKGLHEDSLGYSAFYDSSNRSTGLHEYLMSQGVTRVVITGFVTDVCVNATALDALKLFDEVIVVTDACQYLDAKQADEVLVTLQKCGALLRTTDQLCERRNND
jgi:nicotinamidase/pyrazinamidase